MRNSLKTWLILGVLLGTIGYAVAEDLTLTTYYPSPRGVYNQLLATSMTAQTITLTPPGNLSVSGSLAVGPGASLGTPGEAAFTGHVGIGTTAAGDAQLEIKGSPNATTPLLAIKADPTHQTDLAVFTASNGSAFTITAEGNIGFGTDSPKDLNGVTKPSGSAAPGRTLEIDAGPDEEASLLLTSTRGGSEVGAGMIVINPQAGLPRIKMGGRTAGAPLILINEGQERLRIVPGGNIGIGTTTPVAALDVNGGVRVGNDPSSCDATNEGTIRYQTGTTQYCNGTSWTLLGGVVVSPEVACSGTQFCPLGPVTQWSACFLTAHWVITSSGSWDARCQIVQSGGQWMLQNLAAGGDIVLCRAKCIR